MRFASLVLMVLVLATSPASAQVFVGPNLEWNYWSFPNPDSNVSGGVLSIGGYYLNPGLRLGYLLAGGALAASADAGVQVENLGDLRYRNVIVEPALSYAFLSERATSPYLGFAAGWHYLALGLSDNVTRPLVGGFVGIRHRVSAGHGIIRAEFRYDHFTQKDTKGFVLPENMVGLRLGCDLLLTR